MNAGPAPAMRVPFEMPRCEATPILSRRRWLPIVAVLGAAACWGTQGIIYALILDQIATDGLTVVTLRAATATLLLWVWLGMTDRAALRIPRADLPAFTILGLIAVTVFYPALVYTYTWTSV